MGTVLIAGFDSLHVLNPKAEPWLEKGMCRRSCEAEKRPEPAQKASSEGMGWDGLGPSTGSRQKELIGTTLGPQKKGWTALYKG